MSNKTENNESWYFKAVAFLSLTDTDVLAESGKYDRMLAYAMVLRQLVTFAFTFLLFTYGVSLFLNTTAAVISGFVFALTLFFLDQAIIGSDWALKNPFKGGFPLRKMFGLIPRILYSLIIAIGLATLAEISLQANAIDEQIQKDVVENNKEYFARMALYEKELDTSVELSENKLIEIQDEIKAVKLEQESYINAEKAYDEQTIGNSIDHHQVTLEELQTSQKVMIDEISTLNNTLSKTRRDYQYWFNESILERTGQDGRPPTEGPKYQRAVKTYTELKEMIPIIETEINDTKARLDLLNIEIVNSTDNLNEYQKLSNTLALKETNFANNELTLIDLNEELLATNTILDQQIKEKQEKLDEYRLTLQQEGLFFERKTGVLTRYLALQKIHSDPEYGVVATLFSYMLKVFFIAIELMPVIIKLFFSPFSFYSLKMYRKMQLALMEERELLDEAEMHYQYQKDIRRLEYKEKKLLENHSDSSVVI